MNNDKWKKNEKKLKRIVLDFFKGDKIKVVLFGSRARGNNYISSDVDIGIVPFGKIDSKRITLLNEKIEELNMPYKIEIVNLSETSCNFRDEVLKEAVVWKDYV